MQSIWIFDTERNGIEIENLTTSRTEEINGYEENLTTELLLMSK